MIILSLRLKFLPCIHSVSERNYITLTLDLPSYCYEVTIDLLTLNVCQLQANYLNFTRFFCFRKAPKTFAFDHCFWSYNTADSHFASKLYSVLGRSKRAAINNTQFVCRKLSAQLRKQRFGQYILSIDIWYGFGMSMQYTALSFVSQLKGVYYKVIGRSKRWLWVNPYKP